MRQLCFISMAEDPIISSASLFEVLLFPGLACLHPFQSIPSSFVLHRRRSPAAWSYLHFCRRGQNVAPTKPSFHYFPNAPSITSLNTHFPLVYPKLPISLSLPCTLFEVGNCWEPLMRRYATHLFLVPLSTICTSLLQRVRKTVFSHLLCVFEMHYAFEVFTK